MNDDTRPKSYAQHVAKRTTPSGTLRVVRCTCGHDNEFFVWSWAGHSWAKCKKCGSRINYYTLEVAPAKEKKGAKPCTAANADGTQ